MKTQQRDRCPQFQPIILGHPGRSPLGFDKRSNICRHDKLVRIRCNSAAPVEVNPKHNWWAHPSQNKLSATDTSMHQQTEETFNNDVSLDLTVAQLPER